MKRVLKPPSSSPPKDVSGKYLLVEKQEATLSSTGQEIVFLAEGLGTATNGEPLAVVLSPPAARKLSRMLRREVRKYLRYVPDEK